MVTGRHTFDLLLAVLISISVSVLPALSQIHQRRSLTKIAVRSARWHSTSTGAFRTTSTGMHKTGLSGFASNFSHLMFDVLARTFTWSYGVLLENQNLCSDVHEIHVNENINLGTRCPDSLPKSRGKATASRRLSPTWWTLPELWGGHQLVRVSPFSAWQSRLQTRHRSITISNLLLQTAQSTLDVSWVPRPSLTSRMTDT